MKKPIIYAALVCLLSSSSLLANDHKVDPQPTKVTALKTLEVSSFCKAIMKGDIDMVKKLIELGEDVNQKSLGMTPAIFAARYNKAEILQLLIDNGADLTIRSDKGFTVKKYAELSNAVDALRVIEAAMGS
ncbi:ankyrin repeat domain-containing protein [Pseudozobellia thermophila]|uniref:Ankyrin repeat-containing protein n=1 Tax=Pseudozobellia thermophila TaxID=192903 RepID=A0A1M6JTZ3_9FLAO|nr:ankyrin repeat domain-containing protein [Pseudozobellia thermophila]SHJ50080.1 Ankyrin repeat-containing protein [Pseudozobellia thermophila]